jgi:hypothetical protein
MHMATTSKRFKDAVQVVCVMCGCVACVIRGVFAWCVSVHHNDNNNNDNDSECDYVIDTYDKCNHTSDNIINNSNNNNNNNDNNDNNNNNNNDTMTLK